MAQLISQTFRSVKPPNNNLKPPKSTPLKSPPPSVSQRSKSNSRLSTQSWLVYLILSTNPPSKTYVGVTTNFSRRLKQHNGELKGGAKASRAGRPWVCACLIHGFTGKNKACEFESKWKNCSRKLPRKRKTTELEEQVDGESLPLLQHRREALDRVKGLIDCHHLEIVWQLDSS